VEFPIGRLERGDGGERLQVAVDSVVDDSFKYFRNEIQVRNRTVTGKVFMWQRVLLKFRIDDSIFKLCRKNAFTESKIY